MSRDSMAAGEARGIAVSSQFLPRPESAGDVLHMMRVIQLDALTRVEKSHKLTSLTRLSADFDGSRIDGQLWSPDVAISFETYTHAACLFPIEDWPLLRLSRERAARRSDAPIASARDAVLKVVGATEQGATLRDIEKLGAKTSGWGWSESKRAAEHLVWRGELVCSTRRGGRRVYDLPERRISPDILRVELSEEEILAGLARSTLSSLGIVTTKDVVSHYNLTAVDAERGLILAGAETVAVDGWSETGWIKPSTTPDPSEVNERPRLVGPFDNLLRDRGRARRIFDFDYTFEAYKPANLRLYGHYVLALLVGHELVGRVDAHRDDGVLVVGRAFPEPGRPVPDFSDEVMRAATTLAGQLGIDIRRNT